MADNKVNDFFDRIKNNKILAPVIIAGALIIALINFYNPVKQFINSFKKEKPVNYSEMLDISMKSYDPRFTSAGEVLNWGGGSQSLFVNCGNKNNEINESNIPEDCDYIELAGFNDIVFNVNLVYNSVSGSPKCIIDEWGVNLTRSAETIKDGKFLSYTTGGAESQIEGGECAVNKSEGYFPITIWHDQRDNDLEEGEINKLRPPANIYYLEPGGLIALNIMVHLSDEYTGLKESNGPDNTDLLNLRTYAITVIGGKKDTVYSKQTIKIIFPEMKDSIKYEINTINSDRIEDLRPKTIIANSE